MPSVIFPLDFGSELRDTVSGRVRALFPALRRYPAQSLIPSCAELPRPILPPHIDFLSSDTLLVNSLAA